LKILTDYATRAGATLIAVTHDHDLLSHFDRVIDCKEFQNCSSTSEEQS
jgi:ABC-type lipoprotein export system ATPase subunit